MKTLLGCQIHKITCAQNFNNKKPQISKLQATSAKLFQSRNNEQNCNQIETFGIDFYFDVK